MMEQCGFVGGPESDPSICAACGEPWHHAVHEKARREAERQAQAQAKKESDARLKTPWKKPDRPDPWAVEMMKFLRQEVEVLYCLGDEKCSVTGILRAVHLSGNHVIVDSPDKCHFIRLPLAISRARRHPKNADHKPVWELIEEEPIPSRCTDCKEPLGAQHLPSCHRQGLVTATSDYRDRPHPVQP
jgi:hypothetical protein